MQHKTLRQPAAATLESHLPPRLATWRSLGMLWMIFAVLLILWSLGLTFQIVGPFIHVLLVIAALLLIANLVRGHKGQVF